ncbi:NB-ARC domain-containing protein [Saccharothrix saharensis]|uniref:NB-ARC domain-containing protein n=1 Tax=Saccharothrix saharensis TaxID=571190 RepID=A0A543J656_9PSEU|nr:ATP-binding protein [Saccharothrix saharensis]TQM78324.1 NB-ARC domain-containing protein [Saccharothrix saharensis]
MTAVDPSSARGSTEYLLLLRRRREVAGLSYRQLDRRARQCGEVLPPSTVATMLRRTTLPAVDLLTTFVRACGGDDAEVAAWLAARARITAPDPDPGARAATGPCLPVPPRQLPPGPAELVGRDRELAELDEATGGRERGLVLVTGGPGTGKTALAVHWAHGSAGRFPDGQLYVDLRGHGPGEPVSVGVALAHLLVGLGVPASAVPSRDEQAAALFRSVVADRRIVLVLDGAASADQVRLLRPGGRASCTVVTSRDRLVGLTVHDGGRSVGVGALERGHAVRVLARSAGERLVAQESGAAGTLADLCDGLPLALRIAAGALDRDARTPIADLVAEMRVDGRLAALGVLDDPRARLDVSFGYSYDALGDVERRVFHLLAFSGDLSASVVAVTADLAPGAARSALRRLSDAHLVARRAGDRYAVPGLLREYARTLATPDRISRTATDAA